MVGDRSLLLRHRRRSRIGNDILARGSLSDHSSEDGRAHAWRGDLFHRIIKAILWHDTEKKADHAIRVYLKVVEKKFKLKDQTSPQALAKDYPPLALMNDATAAVVLKKELCTGFYPRTNSQLYEAFLKRFKGSRRELRRERHRELYIAFLAMYHPANPDPALALFFMKDAQGKADGPIPRGSFSISDAALTRFLNRTQQLLLNQGRTQDAAWVAEQKVQLQRQWSPPPFNF